MELQETAKNYTMRNFVVCGLLFTNYYNEVNERQGVWCMYEYHTEWKLEFRTKSWLETLKEGGQ
jgi:hypothetical protein